MYDHIENVEDPFWKFLLLIRSYLRYILMSKISGRQTEEMNSSLVKMMNLRMDLTRTGAQG